MAEIWRRYGKIMTKPLPRYGHDGALQKWDKMSQWRSWDKMSLRKNISGEKVGQTVAGTKCLLTLTKHIIVFIIVGAT